MGILTETKVESQKIFSGKILNVRLDRVLLPNGQESTREVVDHPGAVAVVPVTDDGRVILVKQYRYPVEEILLEIPAGKLDPGEDPDDCAKRELEEETGYVAGRLEKLTSIYTAPGFTNEIIHLYIARDLVEAVQKLDGDEFIDIELFSAAQLKEMVANRTLKDAKTLTGLFLAGY
ncbi:MAG: NUDIX hydrolase [Negativicutes bacterium]|nr:NUDIX hydrolase [Negativicutes bacterium]